MVERFYPKFDLDEGMRLWIFKTASANLWRVSAWLDVDDLVQEGYLAFAICRARYRVRERAHLMALTKITFLNQITDLANKRTRQTEVTVSEIAEPGHETETLESLGGYEQGDADFVVMLSQAPKEVQAVIAALASPEKTARMRKAFRVQPNGVRETSGERLCRLAGVPYFDFGEAVEKLVAPEKDERDWVQDLINCLQASFLVTVRTQGGSYALS